MTFKTDQETFWAGEFGNEYIGRNNSKALLASNLHFFSRALGRTGGVNSCIEFGANIGMNLRALGLLFPEISLRGIEINPVAARELSKSIGEANVFCGSIYDYNDNWEADLSLVKGVLIHLDPQMLTNVYQSIYRAARRFILICEYYNPTPVTIPYRGHMDRLFKRDFAGDMLEAFPDLKLLDYGFSYKRDAICPQDDITWFLMEKGQ